MRLRINVKDSTQECESKEGRGTKYEEKEMKKPKELAVTYIYFSLCTEYVQYENTLVKGGEEKAKG